MCAGTREGDAQQQYTGNTTEAVVLNAVTDQATGRFRHLSPFEYNWQAGTREQTTIINNTVRTININRAGYLAEVGENK